MALKTSILEKYNYQFEIGNIAMLGYMAYQYFKLWLYPEIGDAQMIFQMAGLMGFEFVMVHSGVAMAVMDKKITLYILVPFYALFAWGFNSIIGADNLVLKIYLVVIFNRMRFAFFNPSDELKNKQLGFSVLAVFAYFFLLLFVAVGNSIVPEFGLNPENLNRIGYNIAKTHGGLLLDEPKTAMCLGAFYYLILGSVSCIPFIKSIRNRLRNF